MGIVIFLLATVGGGESVMPVQLHVDVAAWRAQVAKYVEPSQRAAVLAAVDELDRDTKQAVTSATRAIYRWGLLLALGGLLCSLLIPQLPLPRAAAPVPSTEG